VRDDDGQKRIKTQLESSQAFHRMPYGRVRGTAVGEQFRPRKFELFDPVAQNYDGDKLLLQSTHNTIKNLAKMSGDRKVRTRASNLDSALLGAD
jgi:hypothetical protein